MPPLLPLEMGFLGYPNFPKFQTPNFLLRLILLDTYEDSYSLTSAFLKLLPGWNNCNINMWDSASTLLNISSLAIAEGGSPTSQRVILHKGLFLDLFFFFSHKISCWCYQNSFSSLKISTTLTFTLISSSQFYSFITYCASLAKTVGSSSIFFLKVDSSYKLPLNYSSPHPSFSFFF